jgi:GTP-binding protein
VAVVVLDASESLSEQDQRIIGTVSETGRAVVIAFNKWDLVDEDRRYYLDREIDRDLARVAWAPRVNVTARTGLARRPARPGPRRRPRRVGDPRRHRRPQHVPRPPGRRAPAPVRSGKQPKIMFGTQAQSSPPTFVLFTSGLLEASYVRFIERRLREEFGFVGTPLVVNQRPRKKKERR